MEDTSLLRADREGVNQKKKDKTPERVWKISEQNELESWTDPYKTHIGRIVSGGPKPFHP